MIPIAMSKACNVRAWKCVGEWESAWESESVGERSLIMWYWVQETKYKVKIWATTRFWDEGWSSTFFLVCTGEYIYNVKFFNEKLTTSKFFCLHKGPEMHMKVQHPKLPYLAHNTCSVVMWPPWYVWSTGLTQCWSVPTDASLRPLCTDVPMCHIQIVNI